MNKRKRWVGSLLVGLVLLSACGGGAAIRSEADGLVTVNGTELYVKRTGQGDPVVLVHGGPLMDHGYFLPHLEPLAEEYELIFFDMRLNGRSVGSVDSASVRMDTLIDDIEGVRTALGLDRIHLVGHSWGTLLVVQYAARYPEHLRSLQLWNAMGPSEALWRQEQAWLAGAYSETDRADRETARQDPGLAAGDPSAIEALLRIAFRPQFHDRRHVAALQLYVPDDYLARAGQFAYLRPDLDGFDVRDDLTRITAPTLVLYGSAESVAVGLGGVVLRDGIPGAEFATIDGAGHFPFIEQPAAFELAVRDFLSRVP